MDQTSHVTRAIKRKFVNHDYKLTNQFVFANDWESDYFGVTSTGYTYEVEVKISVSDFKADFQKWKHGLFKCYKTGWYWRKRNWPHKKWDEKLQVYVEYNNLNIQEASKTRCPNRFYFACPVGIIKLQDVPEYAGLIYVDEHGNCTTLKEAPFIHKNKVDIKRRDMTGILLSKYYWKSINLEKEIEGKQYRIEYLEQEVRNLKDKLKEGCPV